MFAKGIGNSRSNKFFQELPSHMANRNVGGSSQTTQSASGNRLRSSLRRSASGRGSRGSRRDQIVGEVVDIEEEDNAAETADSYKAMAAPMATKRSVR